MKLFSVLLVAVSLFGVSCERHEFSETRKLNEHHAADAHGEEAADGDKAKDKAH